MKAEKPNLIFFSPEQGEELINTIKALEIPQASKDFIIRGIQCNVQVTIELSKENPNEFYIESLIREALKV